jgi:hypothetical protein
VERAEELKENEGKIAIAEDGLKRLVLVNGLEENDGDPKIDEVEEIDGRDRIL